MHFIGINVVHRDVEDLDDCNYKTASSAPSG